MTKSLVRSLFPLYHSHFANLSILWVVPGITSLILAEVGTGYNCLNLLYTLCYFIPVRLRYVFFYIHLWCQLTLDITFNRILWKPIIFIESLPMDEKNNKIKVAKKYILVSSCWAIIIFNDQINTHDIYQSYICYEHHTFQLYCTLLFSLYFLNIFLTLRNMRFLKCFYDKVINTR